MKIPLARLLVVPLCLGFVGPLAGHSQPATAGTPSVFFTASAVSDPDLIQPEELVKLLQSSKGEKPLLLQVGSHVLYQEAHIPASEYVGAASTPEGLQKVKQRLQSLPKTKFIVFYCGCCPWSHCPNVKPAWDLARSMGFSKIKVLYMANNFGADWVDKGYPTAKGD